MILSPEKNTNLLDTLVEFSYAEYGSALEMLAAAKRAKSPKLKLGYIKHALVEYRHTLLLHEVLTNQIKRGVGKFKREYKFSPQNVLINKGNIHAVIDFGLMGIGDPAVDCLPAWSLLDAHTRSVFKETLQVDDHTWERGKGWELSIALIILPFYRNRNQVLVDVAKRMINELILEK